MRRGRNREGAREESCRHLWKNWNLYETELAEVSKLGEIQMEERIFPSLMGHRFQNKKKNKLKPKHNLCEGLPYSVTHSKSSVLFPEFLLDARSFP